MQIKIKWTEANTNMMLSFFIFKLHIKLPFFKAFKVGYNSFQIIVSQIFVFFAVSLFLFFETIFDIKENPLSTTAVEEGMIMAR